MVLFDVALVRAVRFRRGKYLMKGGTVLGLLLPGAVLREQLIKTAAGRLSITAGALVEQKWLESGAQPVSPPQRVYQSTVSSNVSSAGKDSSSPDCTSACTLMHLHIRTHTYTQSASGAAARHSWKRFPKMLNLPSCCTLKLIRASELLSESH